MFFNEQQVSYIQLSMYQLSRHGFFDGSIWTDKEKTPYLFSMKRLPLAQSSYQEHIQKRDVSCISNLSEDLILSAEVCFLKEVIHIAIFKTFLP